MWVKGAEAAKQLNLCQTTLRKMANDGRINTIWINGKRRYDIQSFLKEQNVGKKVCYARVSSAKQRDDLERQKEYLQSIYPNHEIITDIGSGINFKRKNFKALLEQVLQGDVGEIVVAHKDRLCRFGFDLVEWLCSKFNTKIVVLDNTKYSPNEELTKDLLSIITVFSNRIKGLRKYGSKIKEDKDIPKQETEGDIEPLA